MVQVKKKKIIHKETQMFEKIKKNKTLRKSAIIDHLTGLYNHRYFDRYLKRIISESKKKEKHFSFVIIDIDNFKTINDRYGNLAGDTILINLAKVIRTSVRVVDTCFRYGDEIVIIMPGTDKEIAYDIMSHLKSKIEACKFSINSGNTVFLKLSIGLAVYPADGRTPIALIKKANEFLHKSKRRKRKIADPFILKTRLIPPLLKESVIPRPRLISSLRKNIDKKLILVVADAGYGKTTLLTQFIKEFKALYIWYQIDKSDQEINIFIRYLVEGMRRYVSDFGRRTLSVINDALGREIEPEVLIGTFINELLEVSEGKILLIFDDLQEIYGSKKVVSGFEYLLRHIPSNVSLLVSSKRNLPFSLERLHLKNETLSIDQQDLKFKDNEIKMLCTQIGGYTPKKVDIKELADESEGWITALQFLVPLSRQKSAFVKSRKSLLDWLYFYFDKEIFSTLEKQTKIFLSATSIYDYLLPKACDFLMSRDDSKEILEDLLKKHLFISTYDTPQPSYRYHHLFRNFLLRKLKESNLYHKFQNRAGKYWEKESVFQTAIQHYFEAQKFKSVARLIEKFGDDYINLGKKDFVKYYIEHLPKTIANNSLILIRLLGTISVWNCEWDRARICYLRARRMARRQSNYSEVLKTIEKQLAMRLNLGEYKGVIRRVRNVLCSKRLKNRKQKAEFLNTLGIALTAKGKIKEAIEVFKVFLKLSKRIGDDLLVNTALNNLAVAKQESGDFIEAKNYFESLIDNLLPELSVVLTAILKNLGIVLVMIGNLDKANEVLEESQRYARLFNDRRRLCSIYKSLGMVKILAGELKQAEKFLDKAEKLGLDIGHKYLLANIWEEMAELALNRGDFFKAKQHIDKSLEIPTPPLSKASHLLIKAQAELSLKNLNAAEKALNQAWPNLRESKDDLMKFYLQMVRFYLLKKDGKKTKSFVKKSIALAEKNSYDFLLLYKLKQCPEIIRFIKKIGIRSPYFHHLLLKLPYSEATKILVEPEMSEYDFVVRLFGEMQIFVAGELLKKSWRSKRFKELFCFFIVHRATIVRREKITSIFWPDHNTFAARTRFHNALYKVKKVVRKDIIVFRKEGYTLSPKYRYWIDTEEFERLINEGKKLIEDGDRVASLIKFEQAVSLYQSGFMEDFYSEWSQQKQRYFESICINVLGRLSNGYYKIGNFEKALNFCNLLIDKDPYHENIYCLAMRCYARLNNIRGLQRCFFNLKEILSRDLKITPHHKTIRLFNNLIKERKK